MLIGLLLPRSALMDYVSKGKEFWYEFINQALIEKCQRHPIGRGGGGYIKDFAGRPSHSAVF